MQVLRQEDYVKPNSTVFGAVLYQFVSSIRLACKKRMLASKEQMLAYLLAGILRYAASKERMLGKMQAGSKDAA